jgi:hypothetical protein
MRLIDLQLQFIAAEQLCLARPIAAATIHSVVRSQTRIRRWLISGKNDIEIRQSARNFARETETLSSRSSINIKAPG